MKTVRMTTAGAIVRFLRQQYVRRDGVEQRLIRGVAGIFGHGNVAGLGQALVEHGGDDLPFYQPKNEQGMVHMALAFAKTTNRLGALACTTSVGPGATNMVTGAATATINRLPVLLLPGDIFANRVPAPVLQQLEHPLSMDTSVNDCFRPVSRYWDRIQRPEQILQALPEAMRVLASPSETGAVTIALPEDVQAEAFDCPEVFLAKKIYDVPRHQAPDDTIQEAAAVLLAAHRPLCIAGGGVHYADAAGTLRRFVKRTGIPVGVTQAGKGALLDDDEQCLGAIGATGTQAANEIAAQADVVLAVGTRLSDFTTASKTLFQKPDVRFVNVQVNAFDAHKHGGLPVVGDARVVLERLQGELDSYRIPKTYARDIAAARSAWHKTRARILQDLQSADGENTTHLRQVDVIRIVNDFVTRESTIVHAAGGLPGDLHKLWWSRTATDYHSEYGYSCMGYEIAGALGVKLAQPGRDVYALVGDGSYLMLHTEILTSLQEGLKITIVLLDNGGYQCIHGLQRACGGDSFGNEFRARNGNDHAGEYLSVDFAANARSLGAVAHRAASEAELREALTAARRESRTTLIHVPIQRTSNVPGFAWWDVPMAAVSSQAQVVAARRRYEQSRGKQVFHYK